MLQDGGDLDIIKRQLRCCKKCHSQFYGKEIAITVSFNFFVRKYSKLLKSNKIVYEIFSFYFIKFIGS